MVSLHDVQKQMGFRVFCGSPFFYNIFEEIYHRKSLYCPLSDIDRSFAKQSYITVGCTDPYAQPADG